ncbi:MAG: hypothetical protein RLZZ232_3174 [Planctomycetota bacterium]|jgi:hypothetical protein
MSLFCSDQEPHIITVFADMRMQNLRPPRLRASLAWSNSALRPEQAILLGSQARTGDPALLSGPDGPIQNLPGPHGPRFTA